MENKIKELEEKLLRKEQECEALQMSENEAGEIIAELKAYKDVNEDFKTAWKELKAENDELKKQVCGLRPELKSMIDKICCKYNIEAKYYHEKIVEIINNLDKLSKTLAEIKELLLKTPTDSQMHCINAKSVILQKISECVV